MHFDEIVHTLRTKPAAQRLVLAFAVGLFISCAANASDRIVPAADEGAAVSSK